MRYRYNPVTDTKVCPTCHEEKPSAAFGWRADGTGLRSYCSPCSLARGRRNYAKDRAKGVRRVYDYMSRLTHGVTMEERDAMAEAQDWKCGICGGPLKPGRGGMQLDHHHLTKVIRGLLCINCNRGVGNFRDDPELMLRAAAWLTQERSGGA